MDQNLGTRPLSSSVEKSKHWYLQHRGPSSALRVSATQYNQKTGRFHLIPQDHEVRRRTGEKVERILNSVRRMLMKIEGLKPEDLGFYPEDCIEAKAN